MELGQWSLRIVVNIACTPTTNALLFFFFSRHWVEIFSWNLEGVHKVVFCMFDFNYSSGTFVDVPVD